MRAVVQFGDGSQFNDVDQQFTTGQLPTNSPTVKTTTTAGMSPQSGVELLDMIATAVGNSAPVAVADLDGNVLWSYTREPHGRSTSPY